ncbi:MAG: NfeD family protein [Firmicutes bacterium]|nr:NfeD family protein [Bacillota bacterium]
MDYMIWVWVGIISVSVLVELVTFQMVTLWFAVGGIAALILAACGVGLEWQIIVFLVISIALLIGIRKIMLKLLGKDTEKTNIDALVGKKAQLIKEIALNVPGEVKFNGIIWSAYTKNNCKIAEGVMVEVISVDGNKLMVKKADGTEPDCGEQPEQPAAKKEAKTKKGEK